MNLKVRIKNPVFWVQIILGAFATALAYAGLTAADMTLNDPTTSGVTDSDRAKTYDKPLEE